MADTVICSTVCFRIQRERRAVRYGQRAVCIAYIIILCCRRARGHDIVRADRRGRACRAVERHRKADALYRIRTLKAGLGEAERRIFLPIFPVSVVCRDCQVCFADYGRYLRDRRFIVRRLRLYINGVGPRVRKPRHTGRIVLAVDAVGNDCVFHGRRYADNTIMLRAVIGSLVRNCADPKRAAAADGQRAVHIAYIIILCCRRARGHDIVRADRRGRACRAVERHRKADALYRIRTLEAGLGEAERRIFLPVFPVSVVCRDCQACFADGQRARNIRNLILIGHVPAVRVFDDRIFLRERHGVGSGIRAASLRLDACDGKAFRHAGISADCLTGAIIGFAVVTVCRQRNFRFFCKLRGIDRGFCYSGRQ